jgi:hypothetical protein
LAPATTSWQGALRLWSPWPAAYVVCGSTFRTKPRLQKPRIKSLLIYLVLSSLNNFNLNKILLEIILSQPMFLKKLTIKKIFTKQKAQLIIWASNKVQDRNLT